MSLVGAAMSRPVTVLAVVVAVALAAVLALKQMRVDIFPDMGVPIIYRMIPLQLFWRFPNR